MIERLSIEGAMRFVLRFLILPFLYFVSMLPVVIGIAVTFSSIEYRGALYDYVEPLYIYDDVTPMIDEIALAIIFVIGALVFGGCAWALVLLEKLRQPKLTDHLRRCAYLYVFFIGVSAFLIPEYVKSYRLPGYVGVETEEFVVWLVAGFAIFVDASVLVWQRWRFAYYRYVGVS